MDVERNCDTVLMIFDRRDEESVKVNNMSNNIHEIPYNNQYYFTDNK